MEQRAIITLTSDFGYKDPFAGIMKGVILSINPLATVVDITHGIGPQNVMEAAFAIETGFKSFPHKTIHIVVVDPGVGSNRRPILVATDYHYFIGPDNGVFSRIYSSSESFSVINVTAEHYFLPQRSSTFHGRDIFAPVAAWLSKGISISKFGDQVYQYMDLPIPVTANPSQTVLEGEVIYIDHFGNIITNITGQQIDELHRNNQNSNLRILVKNRAAPPKKYYSETSDKELYSLINSFGYLEFFVNSAHASSLFDIKVGEKVVVTAT
jgi:S-adenosyl-L-methionine hydrolase (adenosine-forming)